MKKIIISIVAVLSLFYAGLFVILFSSVEDKKEETVTVMQDHRYTYVIYDDAKVYLNNVSKDERLDEQSRQRIIERASACTDPDYMFGIMYAESVTVSDDYKPYPYFYVMFEKTDIATYEIVSVEGAALRLDFYQKAKLFSGKLTYQAEKKRLSWRLEGGFFDEGVMQMNQQQWQQNQGELLYLIEGNNDETDKVTFSGSCPLYR